MYQKCLFFNWEKCHFMVNQGIVLGHIISERGIEVDPCKVNVISHLPIPKKVKDVRSFLGHAGCYHRFIENFSKIAKPMCCLLLKDCVFIWNEECNEAFNFLKKKLTEAPIIQPPDWTMPFKIMCDASDYAIGVVLGQ